VGGLFLKMPKVYRFEKLAPGLRQTVLSKCGRSDLAIPTNGAMPIKSAATLSKSLSVPPASLSITRRNVCMSSTEIVPFVPPFFRPDPALLRHPHSSSSVGGSI
jgi:hypothetical protein